jgi:hypothetical protein
MKIYQIDPLADPRWGDFIQGQPHASVFHTAAWLQALKCTYGYTPVVYTTAPPGDKLRNGLAFCQIQSWLTGKRLVSLPYSDHCELLGESKEEISFLIHCLQNARQDESWKFVEVRPVRQDFVSLDNGQGFTPEETFFVHLLDLSRDIDSIYADLDKDCVQRRIQRAQRGGLVEECGKSEILLKQFYRLFVITRSRHGLPPIPYAWFRNLIQYFGDALEIRLASKDSTPVSAILTLRFKDTLYYKYGCSDARFKRFGSTPWLLWSAIKSAKLRGAKKFDLGRTEAENTGLLNFKNNWVPKAQRVIYWRFPNCRSFSSIDGWKSKLAKRTFSNMPASLLRFTADLIYRHFG